MRKIIFVAALALSLSGCGAQMGSQHAKTVATGSAAGSTTENASDLLERCKEPLGTVAVDESYAQHMQNIVYMPYMGN